MSTTKGQIKCTFAEVYDKNGEKVATLCRDSFGNMVVCSTGSNIIEQDTYVPVTITDEAKIKLAEYYPTKDFTGTFFVKKVAIKWSEKNSKWWIVGALALGSLLLLNK